VLQAATVEVGTPIVAARLVPAETGSGFRLEDGILTGRIGTRDMLDWFGARKVPIELSPTQIACDGQLFKQGIRPTLCKLVDSVLPASNDFKNNIKCNAVSVAFRFTAEPALFGTDTYDLPAADASCTANPENTCEAP
jgi:hypothetical protein